LNCLYNVHYVQKVIQQIRMHNFVNSQRILEIILLPHFVENVQ